MFSGSALAAIACACVLALSLLGGGAVDAAVWRVPVHRRAAAANEPIAHLDADPLRTWGSSTNKHTNVWTPSFPANLAHATQDINLILVNGSYVAEFLFGTPPQPVSLEVYLDGSDLWAFSHKLGTHEYYDHNKSSTYRANGTRITIGDQTHWVLRGFVPSDHLTIPGNDGGLQVQDVFFVELDGPDRNLDLFSPRDGGVIGLGPHPNPYTGTPSIMRTMIAQGLLDRPIVGVSQSELSAHLTFGGVDAFYKDKDIKYFSETRNEKYGWWVPLTSIRVASELIVGSCKRALIDQTSLRIAGPRDQVDALSLAVGVRKDGSLPCGNSGPSITISLGSFELTLTNAAYTIPSFDRGCEFAFYAGPPDLDHWVLGRSFMKFVYIVLDYGNVDTEIRLGLAHN